MPVESPSLLPLLTDALALEHRPLWRKVLRRIVGVVLGLTATGLALTLIAWLGLHWFILPHIDQWRAEIETRTSAAVGVPVRLGSIQVESKGWSPTISLRDVVFLDAQGRQALLLPQVWATLSPRSVLALEPRFRQLVIDGAHLEIERDAQGRLSVAGIPLQTDRPNQGHAGMNWLFRQEEIAIRGSSLRWTDRLRQAPALALTDVQLVIRNGLRDHGLRLDATPPPEWGLPFSLRGQFNQALLADSGDWTHWSGTLYSELPQADVSQLKRYMQLPFALEEGAGALRAWIEFQDGDPVSATVDLALRSVAAQLAPDVTPLALQKIQGRLSGERRGDTVRVSLGQFGFTTTAGLEWPRSDIALSWQQAAQGPLRAGELNAQRLDLGLMAQVATHLPLSATLRDALEQAQPRGVVQGLSVSWDGPVDAPTHYKLKGLVRDLKVDALPAPEADPQPLGRPGIHAATVDINATEKGGRAQVQVKDGHLTWPGLWEEPTVPLASLNAQVQWRVDPVKATANVPGGSRLTVELTQAQVANEDLQGEARATWTHMPAPVGEPNPGVLDLTAHVQRAHADRVVRYLPQRLSVRRYLSLALQGGRVSDVNVRLQGDLRDFPFRPSGDKSKPTQGDLRITTHVDDLTLAYVPNRPAHDDEPAWTSPWPAFTGVGGDLIFERGGMQIRNAHGQYQGLQLHKVQGGIRELSKNGVLALEGLATGPVASMLDFVHASPLGLWTGQAMAKAQSTGNGELKLSLSMPLMDAKATTLKGALALAGNTVRWSPELPALTAVQGNIDFTQRSVTLSGLGAKLLGGDTKIEGGWQADTGLQILAQGSVTAEGLRQSTEWPEVARIAQALQGQTTYRLALGSNHGRPEISLTSSGQGLSADLPAPLHKAASDAWTLRLQTLTTPPEAGADRASRDTLRLTLGPQVQALYTRDVSGPDARVLRGQIHVGEGAGAAPLATPSDAQGGAARGSVSANITLPSLDLDGWRAALSGRGAAVAPANTAAQGNPAPAAGGGTDTGTGYLPSLITLRVQEVTVAARKLQKVVAQVSHDDDAWRAKIDADQLNGQITYQGSRGANGQVTVRLARLNLPASDTPHADPLAAPVASTPPTAQPDSVPALDIVIDDFELRGKKLGRLEIEASNPPGNSDTPREWRLSRLLLSTPEAKLTAVGQWGPSESDKSGPRRLGMDFKLDLNDSGAFVERMGMGRTIRGGKGVMTGQLSWTGSPLSPDLSLIAGQMNVAIESGQFLKAEPGAARLLSVLSLQSLPRRFALDFRDVFQEGFAFDGINGDVKLNQGIASTNNLRMRGVQAVVLMEGQADLQRETQDLRVVIVPDINAGTASLAYAVINPALGLGTFLAQLFLRKPLAQASTKEFHITGTWADPQVVKVDHKPDNAPEPSASASASDDGAKR